MPSSKLGCMQVLVEVLGKCLRSECLLMWSAEDTCDTSEGCMRSFHIFEVLGSADGAEVSCLIYVVLWRISPCSGLELAALCVVMCSGSFGAMKHCSALIRADVDKSFPFVAMSRAAPISTAWAACLRKHPCSGL